MRLKDEVESELSRINLSRSRFAYILQAGLLAFSVWYQTGSDKGMAPFILALGLSGCLLRFFSTKVIRDENNVSDIFLWAGYFLLSTAWVFHVDQALRLHGQDAQQIQLLRVFLGSLILANNTLLVADFISYYIFIVPLGLGLIAEVFYFRGILNHHPLYAFFAIATVSSIVLHFQNRQLRSLIFARLEATREKNRMKKFIDGVPGFVGIINREGRYVDGNRMILKYFPDLVGSSIGELSNQSSYSVFVSEFLSSEKDFATGETSATLNGDTYHFVTTCGRIDDGGIIAINLPINELVKARKDLREKEVIAQYSSKLASIGQMAAGVAHEVNNPLAIIQGSANIISGLIDEEPIDRINLKLFSEKIVTTTDRIAQIVRSLRSLSRGGEKDPFSPLSIKSLLNSVQDISNHNFRSFEINFMIPENKKDITVLGREVQLGQVLLNLLSNAIDAVKNLPERWVMIDYGHLDGNVWIEVVDSGKGIPAEHVEKLWDPFFTTKVKDEGTGLGLSISSNIIEEHGGKLTYEANRPNTTFRLTFPTLKI